MRFGWLAVAAAVLLSGQARADDWLRYSVTASGTVSDYTDDYLTGTSSGYSKDGILTLIFDVRNVAGTDFDYGPGYFATQGYFSRIDPGFGVGYSVSGTDTSLAFSRLVQERGFRERLSAGMSFAGGGSVAGFPTSAPLYRPTDTVSFVSTYGSQIMSRDFNFSGRVTAVSVASAASFADYSVSVTALPEPATWAMLIFGFGVVGSRLRSSRAASASPARQLA
jgi:hypothetical protein